MESPRVFLLDVWREACRHIEIPVSTATIAEMLLRQMPLEQLYVRRLDVHRACLETVAVGLPVQGDLPEARTELPPDVVAAFSQADAGRLFGKFSSNPDWAPKLVPGNPRGDWLAGPLGGEKRGGVLVVTGPAGHRFEPCQTALVQLLLEPFSVALENDHRLREVAALREAAEADKRSLLTKLGRKAVADAVVGADSGLRAVMERVELVARSDLPVLIVGETGTGKEVVARLIHNRSARGSGPFIRVNCGAIPAELIDSQLFGHERGAFTGAVETRQGWFERADGGTLLLDELGELPLAAQVRLLRILQDGWVERVGGANPIHVDVRIVAATHRDLATMVDQGRFREDLWYRIAVFPIRLPPLRERREDIAPLAAHFAERAATRFGLPKALPTADDIALLQGYEWPGNIRELGAVIDRAAILGNGLRLAVAPALGQNPRENTPAPRAAVPRETPDPAVPFLSLDEAMRRHIEAALRATQGKVEGSRGAAALLRINPHTLRARMRKLGIAWQAFRRE